MLKFLKQKVKKESFIPFVFLDRTPQSQGSRTVYLLHIHISMQHHPRAGQASTHSCSLKPIVHITKQYKRCGHHHSPFVTHIFPCQMFLLRPSSNTRQKEDVSSHFLSFIEGQWIHGHKNRTNRFQAKIY